MPHQLCSYCCEDAFLLKSLPAFSRNMYIDLCRFMELWPRICWTQLTSTPSSIKYVANECLNIWGVMFLSIPACSVYFSASTVLIALYTYFLCCLQKVSALSDRRFIFSIVFFSNARIEVLLIWTYLSFPPFPINLIRPVFRLTLSFRILEISYTLAPVAKILL